MTNEVTVPIVDETNTPEEAAKLEAAAEALKKIAEDAKPKAVRVEEIDRLKAENINLRLLNAIAHESNQQHNLNNAQRALQEAQEKRVEITREVEKARDDLSSKYGIDFTKYQIGEHDGVIRPRANPGGGPISPQLAAQMAAMSQRKG